MEYSPELQRLLTSSAQINNYFGEDFDVSFSSLLLAFLASDDMVSQWFQAYVKRAGIDVGKILEVRKAEPRDHGGDHRSGWPPARGHAASGLACIAPQLPEQEITDLKQRCGQPVSFAFLQLILNAPELLQRSLQPLHDLPRQDLEVLKIHLI